MTLPDPGLVVEITGLPRLRIGGINNREEAFVYMLDLSESADYVSRKVEKGAFGTN